MRKEKTDWDKYYHSKKSIISSFTQKFTLNEICNAIQKHIDSSFEILECGGGRSCFANDICRFFPEVETYDIIDNNMYAVSLFKEMLLDVSHEGMCKDLLKEIVVSKQYDFVYSIGLIEHFSNDDRKRVINTHLNLCKPGGIVFISFPTPTLKYRAIRKFMELIGVWQFWDETPLSEEMVRPIIEEKAKILECKINRKLPLSQMIIIARRYD